MAPTSAKRVAAQCEPNWTIRYAALRARGCSHGRAYRGLADGLLRVAVAMLRTRTLYCDPTPLAAATRGLPQAEFLSGTCQNGMIPGMRTINLRLDPRAAAGLDRVLADRSQDSQNQVINEAVIGLARLAAGAYDERSWRLGEAAGLRSSADWLKMRADFLEKGDGMATLDVDTSELRWAATQLGATGVEVLRAAARITRPIFHGDADVAPAEEGEVAAAVRPPRGRAGRIRLYLTSATAAEQVAVEGVAQIEPKKRAISRQDPVRIVFTSGLTLVQADTHSIWSAHQPDGGAALLAIRQIIASTPSQSVELDGCLVVASVPIT